MFMKIKLDDGGRDGDRNFRYYEMSISSEEKNIKYLLFPKPNNPSTPITMVSCKPHHRRFRLITVVIQSKHNAIRVSITRGPAPHRRPTQTSTSGEVGGRRKSEKTVSDRRDV